VRGIDGSLDGGLAVYGGVRDGAKIAYVENIGADGRACREEGRGRLIVVDGCTLDAVGDL